MVLKPVNEKAEKIIDQDEEEFEDSEEEMPEEEPERIKKAISKKAIKEAQEPEQSDEAQPTLTRDEVMDMLSGHLNRAYQLLQALR